MKPNDQAALKKLIEDEAENHPILFGDNNAPYTGNTHENCAQFLFDVSERARTELPHLEVGLLSKEDGENGYTWPNGIRTSHDAIAIPNGERFDAIGSAGSTADKPTPTFKVIPPHEWRAHNVWVEHTDVEGMPKPPEPEEPDQEVNPYPDENTFWKSFEQDLSKAYKEAGVDVPPEGFMCGRWFARTAYDLVLNMTEEESYKKHLNEARAELRLPPV